jgi:hypothetical protein
MLRLVLQAMPTLQRSAALVHPSTSEAPSEPDRLVQGRAADYYAMSLGAGLAEYSDKGFSHNWTEYQRVHTAGPPGEHYLVSAAVFTRATEYRDDNHRRHDIQTGALYWLAGHIFRHMFHQAHFGPVSNVDELCHAFDFFLWSFHSSERPVFTSEDKQRGLILVFSAGVWLHVACDKEVGAPSYTVEKDEEVVNAMVKWYLNFHDGWCDTRLPPDTDLGATHAFRQGEILRRELSEAAAVRQVRRIGAADEPHTAGAQRGANTHGNNTHHT